MTEFDDRYYLEPGAPLTDNYPTRCPKCSRPVEHLSVFPGGLCLSCHAEMAPMPTADEVVQAWGGRMVEEEGTR